MLERLGHAGAEAEGLPPVQARTARGHVGQGPALEMLERYEERPCLRVTAHVVDGHDPGVRECG